MADLDFAALPPVHVGSTLQAEAWLALSLLRARSEGGLSVVSTLATTSVVVGVATLHIVIAVMTGFEVDLREKIIRTNAHVLVVRPGGFDDAAAAVLGAEAVEGVAGATPYVTGEALLRAPMGATGIVLRGIDPERARGVTRVHEQLVAGALFEGSERGMVLGSALAQQLLLAPGDEVQLVDPLGTLKSPLGPPRTLRLEVTGIAHSGWYEFDSKWAYVPVPVAQEFLGIRSVTGLEVLASDGDASAAVAARLEAALPGADAKDWRELNAATFAGMELSRVVMSVILFLVVGVAALLILSTLLILVMTKGREIAILRAMGASRGTIRRVFVLAGAYVGVLGTAVGSALGLLGCWALDAYGFPLSSDVYTVTRVPVAVTWQNVAGVTFASLAVCLLATVHPAGRAAAVDPVEGLRYE